MKALLPIPDRPFMNTGTLAPTAARNTDSCVLVMPFQWASPACDGTPVPGSGRGGVHPGQGQFGWDHPLDRLGRRDAALPRRGLLAGEARGPAERGFDQVHLASVGGTERPGALGLGVHFEDELALLVAAGV